MSYQKRLKDFFKKNDPDRLYLAKQISRSFRQDEDAVFKRLEEIYQKGGPSKLVYKELSKSIDSKNTVNSSISDKEITDSEPINTEENFKSIKSKKKLILSLLISVLVVVVAYFSFTIFMGNGSGHEEQVNSHDVEVDHSSSHETDSIVNAVDSQIEDAKTDSTELNQDVEDSTLNDMIEAAEVLEIIK